MIPNKRNAAQAYKLNAIKTASPARLTSMLYDAAVRFTDAGIELMENDPNNYLEVEDDLITKIAPARVGRIQKALDNLRGKLYALRIEINLIQE